MKSLWTLALPLINHLLGSNPAPPAATSSLPSIDLTLTPVWSSHPEPKITHLEAGMIISIPPVKAQQPFLELVMEVGKVPSMNYTGSQALIARDDGGSLTLVYEDDDTTRIRRWWPERKTRGDIHLGFKVFPRRTDISTPPGPRIDFRENNKGLIGTGNVFVPTVLSPSSRSVSGPQLFNLTLNWDLSSSPTYPPIQTIWTYGEGSSINRIGPADDLVNTVYMVGQHIQSYTDPTLPGFGFYWLTPPPPHFLKNPNALAKQIAVLFPSMSSYFNSTSSDSYRVFLRESPRGYGGGAYKWSFILEWDAGVRLGRDEGDEVGKFDDLYFLVGHEMVHNWPGMDEVWGQEGANTTWYSEGVATYYAAVMPYESHLIPPSRFLTNLNQLLSAYYTSPAINMSSVECTRSAWSNTHAQRLPYYRGGLFLLHVDAEISRRSEGKRRLLDSVKEVMVLRGMKGSVGFEEWEELLEREVGSLGAELYAEMSAGRWTPSIPDPALLFGEDFIISKEIGHVYEHGFDIARTHSTATVTNLIADSRAALAGIRNGDIITYTKYSTGSMDEQERENLFTFRREGVDGEFEVKWWPRGRERVDLWQYRLREGVEG